MQRRRLTDLLLGALLILGLPGCGENGLTDSGPSDGKVDVLKPDAGAPPAIITQKKAGETAEVTFTEGGEYLVVPYSVSETSANAISFEIKIGGGASGADAGVSSQSYSLRLQRPRGLKATHPVLWQRWQQRLAVEAWSRSLAEKAASSRLAPKPGKLTTPTAGATCTASVGGACDQNEVCVAGTCQNKVTLKVGAFSATETIEVEVKKKGTKAAILVEAGDTVQDTTLTAMLDKFEKIIIPRMVGLFGDPELKSGAPASDRNADGLVWLVLTKKVQEKNAVGFFVATDFDEADAKSNKADILYIDSAAKLADTFGIMAHEFQHLLNFGAKVYRPKADGTGQGALEALWLDEGQAHFAEDACGFGGENVILLKDEVFPGFSDTALFESSKDGLAMRGMAMTFVRYLFEQKGGVSYNTNGTITDKGGAKILAALHTSDKQGTEAVTAAYSDFKAAFDAWVVAIALDGRGVTDYPAYIYQELIDDPVATEVKIGLKIRGSRKDHTGTMVQLEGPLEDDLTGDVSETLNRNATARFFKLKGKSGKVTISVTSQEQDFRFAVIKLK